MFTLVSESDDASPSHNGDEGSDDAAPIEANGSNEQPESIREAERPAGGDKQDELAKLETFSDDDEADTKPSRKRKRLLSPRSYLRAEKQYFEALDQRISMQEERRLWQALRLSPPERLDNENAELPTPPVPVRRDGTENVSDWRRNIKRESEWERYDETVADQEFAQMETRGRRGRKRRKALHERLRERDLRGGQSGKTRNEPNAVEEGADAEEGAGVEEGSDVGEGSDMEKSPDVEESSDLDGAEEETEEETEA